LGYTCESFAKLKSSKTCRYCGNIINRRFHKEKAFADICGDKECIESLKYACTKINKCGHPCCGFKNEKECPPCFFEECEQAMKKKLNG